MALRGVLDVLAKGKNIPKLMLGNKQHDDDSFLGCNTV
jgi:hypothetical protein